MKPHHIALIIGAGALPAAGVYAQNAAPAPASEVQEIVVTATKVKTLASRTPVSLAVVGGEDLKANGAADTRRLAELIPNVQLGDGAQGGVEVTIRGIGANNNTEVGDPVVGINIDGIYLGRPQMAGAALYDVERVEVLRGPQGTLYGRNSTAGAINVITNKPISSFEGSASLGISSLKGKQGDVMLNLPVNGLLSFRGVLSALKRDGYVDSAHAPANNFSKDKSDKDNTSARLHALFKFAPSTTLLVSGDYAQDGGAGPGAVAYTTVQANPRGAAGRYVANSKVEGRYDVTGTGLTAELNHSLTFADVTVLAAHRTQERHLVYSVAEATSGNSNHSNWTQDSLETRLASNGKGPLQWVAGLYAFSETGEPVVLQALGGNTLFFQRQMETKSLAAFGQASFAVTTDLRLTAGLRQTQDEKGRVGCSYPFAYLNGQGRNDLTANTVITDAPDAAGLPPCPAANINNVPTQTWRELTYKLGADYNITPEIMVYVSYATGFKAGGFNDGDLTVAKNPSAVLYDPETLKSIELGLKGRYLQRRLQVSAALYSYDYTNLQVKTNTTCLNGVGTCAVTQNAGKAKSTGLEVEGRYKLTPAAQLTFGLGLTQAKYTSFTTQQGFNWTGLKLDRAPSSSVNLGYSHSFNLSGGMTLTAYIGERYSAKYEFGNPANNTRFVQSAFNKTDVHVTLASVVGDREWSVQAYARNLEDRNVITGFQASSGQNAMFLGEPRILGVRGSIKF